MNGILFSEQSREELIDIILKQRKEIEELNKRLQEAQAKKKTLPNFVKPSTTLKRHRKPGQKVGHKGVTRSIPEHVDETIESTLTHCPHCTHSLSTAVETLEHTQEDIVPMRVKVTKFIKFRYWCPGCQKIITSPYHKAEVPHGYLGPNTLVQAMLLKYHHHLPYNKIKELLKQLTGLEVSEGALAQAAQRLSIWLGVEVKTILEAIRKSPQLHIDETGWRVHGKNHWLWAFVNRKLAYYQIKQSRGSKIPRRVLGKNYPGIITTDFYSAYFRLPYEKQKCIVHLFRELHRCREQDTSQEYQTYYAQLKRILDDAIRLRERQPALSGEKYHHAVLKIKERLFYLTNGTYTNQNVRRIIKRFFRNWIDMLRFLDNPAIDWHNNFAERMIRPHVINRNRSFGNKFPAGAKAHAALTSLIHTLQLRQTDPFSSLKSAYLYHRQGNPQPILL